MSLLATEAQAALSAKAAANDRALAQTARVGAETARGGAEDAQEAAETARDEAQTARTEALNYGSAKLARSWAEAAALTGLAAGDYVMVISTDTGTHTDPVVGGTVPNSGVFRYSASPAGLERVGALEGDRAKTEGAIQVTAATTQAERAEAAADEAEDAAAAAQAGVDRYFATLSAGVAGSTVGQFFASAETGSTRIYERTGSSPFYVDQGDKAAPATKVDVNQIAYIDFTTKPDGTPPDVLDSGQSVDFVFNASGRAAIMASGRLKINPAGLTAGSTADYYQAFLSETAHRVGCEWTWPASANYGSGTVTDNGQGNMTVAAWAGNYEGGGQNVPASWCHLSIIPGTGAIGQALWFVCAGDGIARFRNVKTQTFVNPPRDSSARWRVDAVLDLPAGMAYARLPDGSVMTLSNAEIAAFMTAVGVTPYTFADCSNTPVILVEHFANTGANSALYPEFTAMWGETQSSIAKPWLFKGSTLLDELKGDRFLFNQIPTARPAAKTYAPTTALVAATTTSAENVDAANAVISCVAGVGGNITYDIAAYYEYTGTDRVFWRLVLNNGFGTTPARVVDIGVSGTNRSCRFTEAVKGLTPGLTYTATLQHFAVTGGLATLRAGGSVGSTVPPLTFLAVPS